MTRIDFYQIADGEQPLHFCCRLVDKAYRQGHRIYILTSSVGESSELDELLWSFRPDRFLPHSLLGEDQRAPIHIGHGDDPGHHDDVLVNLSGRIPEFFSRFERVTEIVPHSEKMRENARNNYRFYKDRGYPLEYHDLQKPS